MLEKSNVPYDTVSEKSVSTETMFNRCCCCIPIRIGCFILGYVSLIYHTLRTITLIGITTCVGIRTHGFDHIDFDPTTSPSTLQDNFRTWDHKQIQLLGFVLVFVAICDVIWLGINIACLVGIHKKRPGPIRVYASFATFRLIMNIVGCMYMFLKRSESIQPHTVSHILEIGVAAYFIFVYYIYAMRLEKENREVRQVQVNDIAFVYPKLDKQLLVV